MMIHINYLIVNTNVNSGFIFNKTGNTGINVKIVSVF